MAALIVLGLTAPAGGRPEKAGPAGTRIWMRNVVMYPYNNAPAAVMRLSGTAVPTGSGRMIDMDYVASYAVRVRHAEVRIPAGTMQALMNQHILPNAGSAIQRVSITFGNGTIQMRGTMRKLGLPIGFTATATAAPSANGDMQITITRMKAAGFIPKSVMDALGLKMDKVAQPDNRGVFRIVGNTMFVPVSSMFPPPRIIGPLRSVRITPQGLISVLGTGSPDAPRLTAPAYIHMRGGQVNFGRLTMANTDLTLVPKGRSGSLGFSPANYYRQLVAGYSNSQPDFGLVSHIADYRTLGSRS